MVINDEGRWSTLDIQVCHSKIIIYQGSAAATESHKFNHFINHNDSKINLNLFSTEVVETINTVLQGPGKILAKNLGYLSSIFRKDEFRLV